jgi:hypothetical protein
LRDLVRRYRKPFDFLQDAGRRLEKPLAFGREALRSNTLNPRRSSSIWTREDILGCDVPSFADAAVNDIVRPTSTKAVSIFKSTFIANAYIIRPRAQIFG